VAALQAGITAIIRSVVTLLAAEIVNRFIKVGGFLEVFVLAGGADHSVLLC